MPDADEPTKGSARSLPEAEDFRMYYALQYQRIAQHENARLQLSNYVVAASVIALGILSLPQTGLTWVMLLVPVSVSGINILAILYAAKSRFWIKLHQNRARLALTAFSPRLLGLQDGADESLRRPRSDHDLFRRQRLEAYIHSIIAVVGIAVFTNWLITMI